jgi:hypothetical protein
MMPLPDWMAREIRWEDFRQRATWKIKFCWWPRRCYLSDRGLWLRQAYLGETVWTGPGEPILEQHWLDPQEYIIGKIKGTI